jgi:hypothetical protein
MIDDNTKSGCLEWSSGECVIISDNLNIETHFNINKPLRKTALHDVSQREMRPLPRVTTRWLLNFIRLQSRWIPRTTPFLHAAVRLIWHENIMWRPLLTLIRCRRDLLCFLSIVLITPPQVIKLSPSSHRGPELKHAALDGVQQSDKKTNETFESMLSKLKLTDASDSQIQGKS